MKFKPPKCCEKPMKAIGIWNVYFGFQCIKCGSVCRVDRDELELKKELRG